MSTYPIGSAMIRLFMKLVCCQFVRACHCGQSHCAGECRGRLVRSMRHRILPWQSVLMSNAVITQIDYPAFFQKMVVFERCIKPSTQSVEACTKFMSHLAQSTVIDIIVSHSIRRLTLNLLLICSFFVPAGTLLSSRLEHERQYGRDVPRKRSPLLLGCPDVCSSISQPFALLCNLCSAFIP